MAAAAPARAILAAATAAAWLRVAAASMFEADSKATKLARSSPEAREAPDSSAHVAAVVVGPSGVEARLASAGGSRRLMRAEPGGGAAPSESGARALDGLDLALGRAGSSLPSEEGASAKAATTEDLAPPRNTSAPRAAIKEPCDQEQKEEGTQKNESSAGVSAPSRNASARVAGTDRSAASADQGSSCQWDDWTEWSHCSKTCGEGVRTKSRTVVSAASNGGAECSGASKLSEPCNVVSCPVNCAWTDWEDWSNCTRQCGFGQRTRTRTVAKEARWGGLNCSGNATQDEPCNSFGCPVDCQWGTWTGWTDCSRSCAGGTTRRTRKVVVERQYAGQNCSGNATEAHRCGTVPCPVDCVWDDWSAWTKCSKVCGNGTMARQRDVKVLQAHGGVACVDDANEEKECGTQPCPISCEWADWDDWGACPATCGSVMRARRRDRRVKARFGGPDCMGKESEQKPCEYTPCPVDCSWQDWGPWDRCICGERVKHRVRAMAWERHGGASCPDKETGGVERAPCDPNEGCVSAVKAVDFGNGTVQKAPSKAAADAAPESPARLTVSINKQAGQSLGIEFSFTNGSVGLNITKIETSGLVAGWNNRNSCRNVTVGDAIVDVNGVEDPAQMVEELRAYKLLRIVVVAQTPRNATAIPKAANATNASDESNVSDVANSTDVVACEKARTSYYQDQGLSDSVAALKAIADCQRTASQVGGHAHDAGGELPVNGTSDSVANTTSHVSDNSTSGFSGQVAGSISLSVAQGAAASFKANSAALSAMREAVAALAGVPPALVQASLSLDLRSGVVAANFTVDMSQVSGVSFPDEQSFAQALARKDLPSVQEEVNFALSKHSLDYVVEVKGIGAQAVVSKSAAAAFRVDRAALISAATATLAMLGAL